MSECDPKVYRDGQHVFLTHTIPGKKIEEWVQMIAKDCGQKVDWHYIAGRANIKTLGDAEKTRNSIAKLRTFHDDALREEMLKSKWNDNRQTERTIKGIWEYNGLGKEEGA